ncbi:Gfo/Idh/MocA family protein [Kutzneria sp. CA-103260]|uniref:Gfo/Idh/MocA family protein n=1 Tax=Kutzneria sp. CA-103260 TaxID=2802641 RepID=UPI001BAD8EBC|nr:Gfo/Idh/MocA family oxidoreductase [Kutzneria sp. CA-103260]QUQ64351.1 Inositol 2-dehydrogenase/D-chiro-inositol 3-dehydrogenase [Kutzneria sp. CA-103260]
MSGRQLLVGLVGAGRQGRVLARALREVASVQLAAVVDPRIESAWRIATEWKLSGSAVHLSVSECGSSGVHAWIIATPPSSHLTNLTELLRLRTPPKAVLCEKPAAWSLHDVARMAQLAEHAGVHLQFGLHLLAAIPPPVLSWLDGGGLGDLVEVSGEWLRADGDPDWGHFRDVDCPGSAFDLGPHLLGVILPVLGQRSPVRAVTTKMTSSPTTPPLGAGPLHRDSSTEMELYQLRPGGYDLAGRVSIAWSGGSGTGLTIRLGGTEGVFTMRLDERGGDAVVRVRLDGRSARAAGVAGTWETPVRDCYRRQLKNLVTVADTGAADCVPPGARVDAAVASTRLITAAYRSANQGGELVSW